MSTTINVTVAFPLSKKPPYHSDAESSTLVATVRTASMGHFEVQDDPQTLYYLTHDGDKQSSDKTIGEIAGEAHAVKFTLVKELIQG